MKNVLKYSIAALFAAALVFACQKNVEAPEQEQDTPTVERKMITVTCTIEEPDTKVTLTNEYDEDAGKNVGKTRWEMTDEVLFHGKKMGTDDPKVYSCVVSPSSISADGKVASFSIPDLDEQYDGTSDNYRSSLFAIYPASAVANYADGASWKYVQAFKETNHFLLVGYNDTTVDEGNSFVFVPLTGALSFKVSGDFDKYVFAGNNNEVVAYDKYSVTAAILYDSGTPEIRTYYTGGSGAGGSNGPRTSISVTPEGDSWCNGTTVNTIFFPNGANFSSGFTIKFFKSGEEIKRIGTNTGKNIAIGKYLDLDDVTSHLKNPPATHDSEISLTGASDLSASASANCYLIEDNNEPYSIANLADKVYTFKAYKGKSDTGVGNISSVSILWESYNNNESVANNSVIAAVDYDKQELNDYYTIVFRLPESPHIGNAVIAAKNANEDILWSWHIWIPETKVTTGTYGISTPQMMDRNLGALRAGSASVADIQAAGLLYQWGRKDPFLNKKGYISSDNDFTNHASESAISVNQTMSSTQFESVEASIKSPTVLVGKESSDWLTTSDNTLWGASKTVYDPCPPGFKVPSNSDCTMFTNDIKDTSVYTAWSYNTSYYNCTIGVTDNSTVFPFGYLYSNGRFDTVLQKTLIWSSTTSSSAGQSKNLYITSSSYGQYGVGRTTGGAVRCVAE